MGSVFENATPKVIVALDYPDVNSALKMVSQLDPVLCRVKVGFELYVAGGPAVVEKIRNQGFDVFLDLKFHDIPNTVASACRSAASLGVWMMNVHASGGVRMMTAAKEAVVNSEKPPLLIAVTVLTSLDRDDLLEVGISKPPEEQVHALAELAQSCGLDGVVCSALEADGLREKLGRDFVLVTPGVRPVGAASEDQKRVLSPAQALQQGAHHIVVGRPITRAANPLEALASIVESIKQF